MRYKNTLAIAKISVSIYPRLKGSRVGKWLTVILNWRRTDLALWRKFCLKFPTLQECWFAAALAEQLTKDHQLQFDNQDRIFRSNRMHEYAYRALPIGR